MELGLGGQTLEIFHGEYLLWCYEKKVSFWSTVFRRCCMNVLLGIAGIVAARCSHGTKPHYMHDAHDIKLDQAGWSVEGVPHVICCLHQGKIAALFQYIQVQMSTVSVVRFSILFHVPMALYDYWPIVQWRLSSHSPIRCFFQAELQAFYRSLVAGRPAGGSTLIDIKNKRQNSRGK